MAMNARTTTRAFRALRVSLSHPTSSIESSLTAIQQQNIRVVAQAYRGYATGSEPSLKETLAQLIPAKRELLKKVKAHGDKVIGEVKIENTLGGMRYVNLTPTILYLGVHEGEHRGTCQE